MRYRIVVCLLGLLCLGFSSYAQSTDALNLIPYPKDVTLETGEFALARPLVLAAPEKWMDLVGPMVREEFSRAGLTPPRLLAVKSKRLEFALLLPEAVPEKAKQSDFEFLPWKAKRDELFPPKSDGGEAFNLFVRPDRVDVKANEAAGLLYGVQTLVQLLRANRIDNSLLCVKIADRPGKLAWRAYQDDLTRIPSSTFETLRRGIDLGAYFKLNVFTYYMESQFAFKKHPIIGPVDGSLTPGELEALVAYAIPRHVNILGNQQSFGHMERVLCYDEYKPLAETSWILNPTVEATYDFLNDLYSEEMPLLPFPYFNVCCDETQGLGTGPAKALVAEKGEGTVYAQHIARVHALITKRYGKRMMMWGDIVLQHPETLTMIPKDTLMLTWGYEPADSYEGQILPFVKAGYDFVVCPSVRNYGRILPDFRGATVNIQNFTRDGAKHGAWGVINTAWDDGGRTLNAPNWHGIAWGAECAWNDGATSADVFNRRIGKVLFGEREDHFGRGIEALAGLQDIPMTAGGSDSRFWQDPLAGEVRFASVDQMRGEA
ncbi:MAG: beta-N-acetylhexosaminidase, partial [Candidatus Hydrogenedentes bacterium]|nr:beta-N-acetylhexosaminidase [Candidatus Hydrogenedentota bacterium]